MSILAAERPLTQVRTQKLWEVRTSVLPHGGRYCRDSLSAARAIVDLVDKRVQQGRHANLIVVLLGEEDQPLLDASCDVADVLGATGWPSGPLCSRDDVIDLLQAILTGSEQTT